MRREFHSKKFKWNIIIFGSPLVLLIATFAVMASFWDQTPASFAEGEFSVQIGTRLWNVEEEEEIEEAEPPHVTEINDIVNAIIGADPLLLNGTTELHILGQNGVDATPNHSGSVSYFDTVLWVREDETIAVALATEPIAANVFATWENLESALSDPNIPLTFWGNAFRPGNVYTRAHAPISHDGQSYFARHDNITSTPDIGDDWFLINNTWLPQSYPIGSIVVHQGRHFYKISDVDGEPGTDEDIWHEIPKYQVMSDVIPWYQTDWDVYYIVTYEDNFYISLVSNNSQVPGTSNDWALIPRFDWNAIVPEFIAGIYYEIGDLVSVGSGENAVYFRKMVEGASPNPIEDTSGAWLPLSNWHELVEVQTWRPHMIYESTTGSLVVEHNGVFFQKLSGRATPGIPPPEEPHRWLRILSWSESLGPIEYVPSAIIFENTIFRAMLNDGERFYASIQHVPMWFEGSIQTPSEFFRPVEEWNPEQEYSVFGYDVAGSVDRRYHAYTLDEEGNRTFWWLEDSPTGVTGTVTGVHPEDSPFWLQIEFINREFHVVTHVNDVPVLWRRNPSIPLGDDIREPSVLHDDWIRPVTEVSQQWVYTIYGDGVFSLWQRTSTGTSSQEPGFGNDWVLENFRTGLEFVYTINEAGMVTFWRSPTQSSTPPGSSGWSQYSPPIHKESEIVYFEVGDQTLYYATNRGDTLFQLTTAWTSGGKNMQYRWSEHNEYQSGDIVVFGSTRVNTYRYFRLRPGVDPSYTRRVSPMSPWGRQIWEPLRPIDWD